MLLALYNKHQYDEQVLPGQMEPYKLYKELKTGQTMTGILSAHTRNQRIHTQSGGPQQSVRGDFLMIPEGYFFNFSLKPYVVTPHLDRLDVL